jgi:colicin import membrane protein
MKEEAWFKMLVVSTVLHLCVLTAFSIPITKASKRFEIPSSYSVKLVGGVGGGPSAEAGRTGKALPAEKPAPQKPARPATIKKPVPAKTKPVPLRKEKEAVSLSKKKVPVKESPVKESPTKEELSRLEDRIQEIKKRSEYLDVTQKRVETGSGKTGGLPGIPGGGLPGSSEGGGKLLDPAAQRYMLEIWEKIKDAWGLPGLASFKKNLETVVTIKIRKDGRIVDINMEKRSGNRVYDESILRVLRAVDPLPPIPASLNTDSMEIGFRFLPGDIS